MLNNNKEKILEILESGEKSTSMLCSIISRDWYYCKKVMEELESEGKVKRVEIGRFTFWKLRNGQKI